VGGIQGDGGLLTASPTPPHLWPNKASLSRPVEARVISDPRAGGGGALWGSLGDGGGVGGQQRVDG